MPLLPRLRQVRYYLRADNQTAPDIPDDARARMTEMMVPQFRALSPGDQRHLLRVFRDLQAAGADEDTITAGLLHDIGKGCGACKKMTVVERSAHVFLNRFVPDAYHRWADHAEPKAPRLRNLKRLATHAERGARAVMLEEYPERVQTLIRFHERGGDSSDPQLALLRQIDDAPEPTP